mgnify:CR=1 FL=1
MAFFVIIPPGMEPINGNAMNPAALRSSDIFSNFLWSHDVRTQSWNFEICARFWARLIANGSFEWFWQLWIFDIWFWQPCFDFTQYWFYWRAGATCVCSLAQLKRLREHEKIIPSRNFCLPLQSFYLIFEKREEVKERKKNRKFGCDRSETGFCTIQCSCLQLKVASYSVIWISVIKRQVSR